MKIDAVLLTKNSEKPCLQECLEALMKNVPVNRLIVVDANSTDRTLEIIRTYYPDALILIDTGTRATARQLAIRQIETDFFLFLDSDVILCPSWFQKAQEYLDDHLIGAVQGTDYPEFTKVVADFDEAMWKLRKIFRKTTKGGLIPPYERGFTGDVLIRTSLVKEIKIPEVLHVFEDYYIKKFIEAQGYKWLITKSPSCRHLIRKVPRDAYHDGYVGFKMGFISLRQALFASITIVPKVAFAGILKGNPKLIYWHMAFQLYTLIGVLKAVLRKYPGGVI